MKRKIVRHKVLSTFCTFAVILVLSILCFAVQADAAGIVVLKGNWKFHSTLGNWDVNGDGGMGGSDSWQEPISFTSNGEEHTQIQYRFMGTGSELVYSKLVYSKNSWTNSRYQQVNFGSSRKTVSQEFYDWFSANADRVLVKTTFMLDSEFSQWSTISHHAGATYDYYGGFPSEPTRVGYHFTGWYTAPTGGTQVSQFSEVPDYDHKLYAHWEPNVVNIAYVIDGGTVTSSQYSVYVKTDTIMTNYLTVNTTVIQKLTYGTSGDPYNATTFGLTKEGYVENRTAVIFQSQRFLAPQRGL